MKKGLNISIIISLMVAGLVIVTSINTQSAHAQNALTGLETSGTSSDRLKEYTLLEPLPCIPSTTSPCSSATQKTVDITTYVNYIFRLAIALAAFLAVFMFTVGGFQYMTSEAMGGKDEAKGRMRNAVFGLLAALASYIILYTIDPRLVQINANIPDIKVARDDNIFGNLDSNLQAIQNRLDDIRHGSADAIQQRDLLNQQATDARTQAERIKSQIDSGLNDSDNPLTDAEKAALETQYASLTNVANKAADMATVVQWKQAVKNAYLTGLNSTNIADISAQELRMSNDYSANVMGHLNNASDPTVSDMLNKEVIPEKMFETNSLQNYIQELKVTQNTYSTQSSLDAAKRDAISAINNQTNADIARTTDATLKAKYTDDAKTRIDAIKAFKPTISTPGRGGTYSGAF